MHRHLRGLELEGPVPEAGVDLISDGVAAGKITSAAELPLKGGSRIFALGMMRAEAEARTQEMTYTAGAVTGKARLLAAPPTF